MCIRPLEKATLDKMKEFKYKYTNDSIIYNYCLSPFLNKVVNYLPYNLAPNLITFLSLICNIIAFVVSLADGDFNFSQPLKSSTCFVIGTTQILYQLLDNIDGKQARRTGNSTPFGMLMDHGCDVFTTIFTAYNMSRILLVGNDDFFSFSIFLGLLVGFYMMTYEDYKLGEMYFPPINGADEGNFFVFCFAIICGIFGQEWLQIKIYNEEFTIGKLIGGIISIGGLLALFNLYLHTYQKKGCIENFKNILDSIWFYNCIAIPLIYIYYKQIFYFCSKWLVILNSCLIFARITLDLQIKIATMDAFKWGLMYSLSNVIYISSIFINNYSYNFYLLLFLAIVQIIELMIFIFIRVREITNYLDIKIFLVKSKEEKFSNPIFR